MKRKKQVKQSKLGLGLIKGLKEAVAFENKKIDLRATSLEIPETPPSMGKNEVKEARELLNVSQPIFAQILGVSDDTVKAWERGTNKPGGSSARLIQMAMTDAKSFRDLLQKL